MATVKLLRVLGFFALACLFSVPVGGQTAIPHDVIASGGGSSSGGGLRLDDTVGETVIGIMSQGATVHKAGYQYVIRTFLDTTTTAVMIAAFDAEYTDEGVRLEWEISYADGLKGFNIYRSMGLEDNLVRLNNHLIPADNENSYLDKNIRPGRDYTYLLGAVDRDGEFFSQTIKVEVPYKETTLEQNFPNPFNPSTTILFFLSQPEHVSLVIYNVQGKRVKTLIDERRSFGKHRVKWDGRNENGSLVSSGVYYYRMKAGKHVFTRKLTLLK